MKLFAGLLGAVFCLVPTLAASINGRRPSDVIKNYERAALQSVVTWDTNSISVRGERMLVWAGEFHPFRLPVPGLYLDIFQKIRAIGYTAISIYIDWALLEGKEGQFELNGIFDLEPVWSAAAEAGLYITARPGPYINAEVSGGGFPGWLTRLNGTLRETDAAYISAIELYLATVGKSIANAQVTNGGPVILVQPENEYSGNERQYMQDVEDQLRSAGITVPFMTNNGKGKDVPGSGTGAVDIAGFDEYPLGFSCGSPSSWGNGALETNTYKAKVASAPLAIPEFQGGSFDPWGGHGFDNCAALLNMEFERVFYKNLFASGLKIIGIYMTYGGTNWGNIGHPGGYTSYDYGAVIKESGEITREKYSEAKLQATFWRASPAYLTSEPNAASTSYTTNSAITTTPLTSSGSKTAFYVVRHSTYNTLDSTTYKMTLTTSQGSITFPQLGGSLSLNGRDSKVVVTDYPVSTSSYTVLYSSAEVFTAKTFGSYSVLVLYGGPGETHETAFTSGSGAKVVEGSGVTSAIKSGNTVINWGVTATRKVVQIGSLYVYLLDRNSAYNYWVTDLPQTTVHGNYSTGGKESVVFNAGYLIRTAQISGTSLHVTGDVNATTPLEVIGAPSAIDSIYFNGELLAFTTGASQNLKASLVYTAPTLNVPNLSSLTWKYIDSLPELQSSYDDSAWTAANKKTSPNTERSLTTSVSLYSCDYGYHYGTLIYRGHFTSSGSEKTLTITTQGGNAFGHSVWLGSTFLGSWTGSGGTASRSASYTLSGLTSGKSYVLTVVIDTTGYPENQEPGNDQMKTPHGIWDYSIGGTAITWKVTGNLGGESYIDRTRGPLNEGGLYAERHGFHLPNPPTSSWSTGKPTTGISKAGVGFYTTSFDLDFPEDYAVPLSFVFTRTSSNYRVQLYVNGYQFGKYINNIGPETSFPVPEGILNYQGTNYIALSLWAQDAGGATISNFQLVAGHPVQSGYGPVTLSPQPAYSARSGAY